MTERKKGTAAKKTRRAMQERRLPPHASRRGVLTLAATVIGGLAFGAGVYAQWVSPKPLAQAPWIVGGAAVLLAFVITWGDFGGVGVRVGDVGVALEVSGRSLQRLAWCAVQSIEIIDGKMKIAGESVQLSFRIASNPLGAAWIIHEAGARVPKVLRARRDETALLPETRDKDGVMLAVDREQVTGARCRASGRVIGFERDARFCPRCGAVYHFENLPGSCQVCEVALAES